ncbi:MAG: NUDIX hydrolase [Kiritimatiellales bacterium]|nr:NUDIX hydrolase [Kiritimatiellales bacterium]
MTTLWSDKDWKVILEPASLPDGREKKVVRVERPDSAHIIAFTESGNILVLREYRPYYSTYIWMIPSGRVDKEKDSLEAAKRELREETGYRADKMEYYCTTHYSESVIAANHIYIASDLHEDPLPSDDDEEIEVHELPIEEALNNILESEYVHTASAYALLRYLRNNQK